MESLGKLIHGFAKEVVLLELLFDGQVPYVSHTGLWKNPQPSAVQCYAVMRLHDAWGRFCRRLVLRCAGGRLVTVGGSYVPRSPTVASTQSALDALKSTYPTARQGWAVWEPRWFDVGQAIDAAKRLKIGNFSTVSAGLGLTGPGLEDLRACRNFFAHRNEQTDEALDSLRARLELPLSTPAEQLPNTTVFGGSRLFHVWCFELLQRATFAAQ